MSQQKKSLTNQDIVVSTVGRRAALGIIGSVALAACGGAAATGGGVVRATSCTDSDPTDPAGGGRGRGISDSDPTDPVGCGSRACSDSDAGDPGGRGRNC